MKAFATSLNPLADNSFAHHRESMRTACSSSVERSLNSPKSCTVNYSLNGIFLCPPQLSDLFLHTQHQFAAHVDFFKLQAVGLPRLSIDVIVE